jgi:DNA-binding response OmpR family regulator
MTTSDNRTTPWTFVLDEPLRILVVDDDPILREFSTVYLATPSATIETAADGAEARIRLGEAAYDMLLLDIEMPRVDGFSLLEEIRANDRLRHLPVIMLTGHDDIASIDRAYQLGAHAFATKPVNWRLLSYQIRYVARTCRAECLGAAAQEPRREAESGSPPKATETDVRGFLQAVVRRADVLEQGLSSDDRSRYSQWIADLRSRAQRAVAEMSATKRSGACASGRTGSAEGSDVGTEARTMPERKSA